MGESQVALELDEKGKESDDAPVAELSSNQSRIELQEGDFEHHPYYIPISDNFRANIGRLVKSVGMKIFIFTLIAVDVLILIIELSADDQVNHEAIFDITILILSLLLFECILRLLHLDFIGFFTDVWCIFDLVISLLSLILSIVFSDFGRYLVIARLLRLVRVVVLIYRHQKGMKASLRRLVSQNRRRFNQEGFDIDITYITDHIVAMSVPAVKVEALYRNPVGDVAKFFNTKHTKHYHIYNLCPERKYPYDKFDGVTEYFMGDHNPAPLETLLQFCKDADTYLKKDPENIIAVHCKGGKGRTGTMICSYLMYSGMVEGAEDAMEYFSLRRTAEGGEREGIEAKSQERYLRYFQTIAKSKTLPKPHRVVLKYLRVHGIQALTSDPSSQWFVVNQGLDDPIYDHSTEKDRKAAVIVDAPKDFADYFPGKEVVMADDIRICFYQPKKKGEKAKKEKEKEKSKGHKVANSQTIPMTDIELSGDNDDDDDKSKDSGKKKKKSPKPVFSFWFHTSFIKNPFRLYKREIDGVRKSKHPEIFANNFSIDLVFESKPHDHESA